MGFGLIQKGLSWDELGQVEQRVRGRRRVMYEWRLADIVELCTDYRGEVTHEVVSVVFEEFWRQFRFEGIKSLGRDDFQFAQKGVAEEEEV